MKVRGLIVLFLAISCVAYSQIKLQFITVNQYGNNLYLDNIAAGKQKTIDVGILNVDKIFKDTNYSVSATNFSAAPIVTVINMGRSAITTPFDVKLKVTPGSYVSTKSVSALNPGKAVAITFDNLTMPLNTQFTVEASVNVPGDEETGNNVLTFNSYYLPGAPRKIVIEEFTSSTCGPCAANNPTLDAYISANFDKVVPIKYHMNWPSPGNDPMYAYNSSQNTDRRSYYSINAVPTGVVDGIFAPGLPVAAGLPGIVDPRLQTGSPIGISVTNTRIGDTLQADVTVNILGPMKAGNYYLRVAAVERAIHYATAPGSNGEKDFYDVFRKAFPGSLGTVLPTAAGTYNFQFKYKIDSPTWQDSMMYTAVFVQNDVTKEIINAAKSRAVVDKTEKVLASASVVVVRPEMAIDRIAGPAPIRFSSAAMKTTSPYYTTLFEGAFPPAGYKLVNPDNGLTFEPSSAANGPSFGGSQSVIMKFYDYSSANASDTLITPSFTDLTANDTVKFDYAYTSYDAENDRLIVRLSKDGGITWPYTIFDKMGSALQTAAATHNSFVPTADQWKTFSYSLSEVLGTQITRNVTTKQGWNMISVPVTPATPAIATLFPGATSQFYAFNGAYTVVQNGVAGQGFWARFDAVNTYPVLGTPIATSSLPVASGWNLIGPYDKAVTVSAVTSTPAGIVNSVFYGYDNGYNTATTLTPGQAYWVRTTQSGQLNFNTTVEKSTPIAEKAPAGMQIIFTDNSGKTSVLYLSEEKNSLQRYELPPLPPSGIFDIRFGSDRYIESAAIQQNVRLQGVQFPVHVKVTGGDAQLSDNVGSFRASMKNGEEVVLTNPAMTTLAINGVSAAVTFSLNQNYPNPFNPSTSISYTVPANGLVILKVYDVLGRESAMLVNTVQNAGRYTVSFNASSLPSGTYFYELRAGGATQIKKMMLIK
ncbi:MAG: Omp28-related outer membrane protein [Ignavibacteria bacterium]|nr:Omp28-related outer membrane protein [Ignavibacteria bacterium]